MAYAAPWIRAWRDFLGDAKVLRLTLAEEGAWWRLLLLANSEGNVSGNADEVAPLLRMAGADAKTFIEKLVTLGMTRCENGHIAICHWKERQHFSDYSTPRVQKFREKKRGETFQKRFSETEMKRSPSLPPHPPLIPSDKTRGRPEVDKTREDKNDSDGAVDVKFIQKRGPKPKPVYESPPSFDEVKAWIEKKGLLDLVDPYAFLRKNTSIGWVDTRGRPYTNWHSVVATWADYEREKRSK